MHDEHRVATAALRGAADLPLKYFVYAVTSEWTLGSAYIFNNVRVSGENSTRFHQLNPSANYALSKRTALYAVAIAQKASGAGLGVDPATAAVETGPITVYVDREQRSSRMVSLPPGYGRCDSGPGRQGTVESDAANYSIFYKRAKLASFNFGLTGGETSSRDWAYPRHSLGCVDTCITIKESA